MMQEPMEAPRLEELEAEHFVVERGQEPWVVSVTASAKRLDEVKVTWDIIAQSVHVRWLKEDRDVLVLERETVSRISVRRLHEDVVFEVLTRSADVHGVLQVTVGESVSIVDAILRH